MTDTNSYERIVIDDPVMQKDQRNCAVVVSVDGFTVWSFPRTSFAAEHRAPSGSVSVTAMLLQVVNHPQRGELASGATMCYGLAPGTYLLLVMQLRCSLLYNLARHRSAVCATDADHNVDDDDHGTVLT